MKRITSTVIVLLGAAVAATTGLAPGIATAAHATTYQHLYFYQNGFRTNWCVEDNGGYADLDGCGSQTSQDFAYTGGAGEYGTLQVKIDGTCLTDTGNNVRLTFTRCTSRQQWEYQSNPYNGPFFISSVNPSPPYAITDHSDAEYNGNWIIGLAYGGNPDQNFELG